MSHEKNPQEQSLIPQSKRSYLYRFFAQVGKSTWHVSVTQQLITVFPVGLITVLVHINNGLITTGLSWAYVRAAVQTILITYGLIVIINIFRAPFILDKEHQQRNAALSQRLNAMEKRLGLPSAVRASRTALANPEAPKAEPNLICIDARVKDIGIGVGEVFQHNGTDEAGVRDLIAVVLTIKNKENLKHSVATVNYVVARFTFYDADDKYFGQVNHGSWIGEKGDCVDFGVDETQELVLAVELKDEEIRAVMTLDKSFDAMYHHYNLREIQLTGTHFRVEVNLIGGQPSRALKTLGFKLNVEPKLEIKPL